MPLLRWCSLLVLGTVLMAATIEDVRVEQAITQRSGTYTADQTLTITVVLSKAAEVEVVISRAVAGRSELTPEGAFVAETLVIKTLPKQRLAAGAHALTWDGLSAEGKPVTVAAVASSTVGKPAPVPAVVDYPVDQFRITVKAEGEQEARVFTRLGSGTYDPNRTIDTFSGADWAPDGTLVIADRPSWRGRRYTTNWNLIGTFPHLSKGHESDPVECTGAQVDAQGNVYLMNAGSVYRYAPDGHPQEYTSREPHITFPYPQNVANRLGLRLDLSRGVYERNSGDGQRSVIDSAALAGKPGFSTNQFNCFAVGDDGTILLGMREPTTAMWAFANDGHYLREVTLPSPPSAAVFGNGRYYIATDQGILLLDQSTFAVTSVISGINARRLHIGADGTLYATNGNPIDMLLRYTPEGQPKPFAAIPSNPSEAHCLRLSPTARGVPETAAETCAVIQAVVGGAEGAFWISAAIHGDPGMNHKRLLHFSAAGVYQPAASMITLLERQPYHVFVGSTPAAVDLLLTDVNATDGDLVVDWTLTDFQGAESNGSTTFVTRKHCRQVLSLALPASDLGHYRLQLRAKKGAQVVFEHACAVTRIPPPNRALNPDSPFAMCWAVEPGLAGVVGVKIERVGDTYWEKDRTNAGVPGTLLAAEQVRPTPGHNDWWNSTVDGWRDAFTRWGILVPGQFTYGEAWLGGSYPACRIFSYDAWLTWTLGTVEHLAPSKPPYYQFWNEPNFFWHVPGPFSREHFALVSKLAWCAVKARDKEALSISDGDAGGLDMMRELHQHGASGYNDAMQIHYPGVKPLKWDDMTAPEAPESKLSMIQDLVTMRDAQAPGKPIWNTEEGWWGAQDRPWNVGAMALPRIYISQIAAGVDRIYWFDQVGMANLGPDALLDIKTRSAYPTFAAFAQMTHALEGASYVGNHELGAGVFAQVFVRGDQAVVAVWSGKGPLTVTLEFQAKQVTISDVVGRSRSIPNAAKLELPINEFVQYITFKRTSWVTNVAETTAKARLAMAGCRDAKALPSAINAVEGNGDDAMRTWYRLIQAAEACALAGQATQRGTATAAKARAAVLKKEGRLGYLRQARLALSWAERLERLAQRHGNDIGAGQSWASQCAALVVMRLLTSEVPDMPSVAITSFAGEPGEIARIRGTVPVIGNFDTTIDDRFKLDIKRQIGDIVELELTAWNLSATPQKFALVPRVPAGWKVVGSLPAGNVKPGEFLRGVVSMTVPVGTPAGTYRLDATVTVDGLTAGGLHPARVTVP